MRFKIASPPDVNYFLLPTEGQEICAVTGFCHATHNLHELHAERADMYLRLTEYKRPRG